MDDLYVTKAMPEACVQTAVSPISCSSFDLGKCRKISSKLVRYLDEYPDCQKAGCKRLSDKHGAVLGRPYRAGGFFDDNPC